MATIKYATLAALSALATIVFVAVPAMPSAAIAADGKATKPAARLHVLFRSDWEWAKQTYPTFASALGDHRYDDRLEDISLPALQRQRQHRRDIHKRLRAISKASLGEADRTSYQLFEWQIEEGLALDQLHAGDDFGEHWRIVGHLDGLPQSFSHTVAQTRFATAADYRNYLARLRLLPRQLDQAMAIARKAQAAGWSLPRVTMERVPAQLDRLMGASVDDCSWFKPFAAMPPSLPLPEAQALAAEARRLFESAVLPALRGYERFIIDEYLPKASDQIAASNLPNGKAYYAAVVRRMTTTRLTPEEIHALGLREVARIRGQMERIAREEGYPGSATDFVRSVRARPDQYFATGEEILSAYGALGKKVDPLMTQLFDELPRQPWGIRAAPPEAHGQAAHYIAGAPDGSRPGYFVVDTSRVALSPKFQMTALLLHEAVPGHHLQVARAAELAGLPEFRRHSWFTAYGEGWALYAESMGEELGLYADRLDLLGRYTYEIWRAARLVVDTGMHALGWSRQQAIEYLHEATGGDLADVTGEIDRYIAWPGQALAYKIGELTIRSARQRAEQALGSHFDLRKFHNLLLDAGAMPLSMLEARVTAWISGQESTARSPARKKTAPYAIPAK